MNKQSNHYYLSKVAVLAVIAALLIFNYTFYGTGENAKRPLRILSWDVFGYYLYLPATFIYADPGLKNETWLNEVKTKYEVSPYLYQIAGGSKGKKRIIYPVGLSYFYAPGFFIAHALAKPLDYNCDGFAAPYQWSVLITSLLVTFLGLFYLRKLLSRFFSDAITAVSILLICFGTNWFLTVGYMHGMPHSFLFTLNVLIIYFTKKWLDTHERKYAILTAFALAWAYNCRPTELIWVLIPLLWNINSISELKLKWRSISTYRSNLIAFAATFIVITLPQLAYMQYASNDILKVNLHTEKLSLFEPYTLQFLFSYKKGWLLYTPLMLFAIAGFTALYKIQRNIFYALSTFFIINLWVTSSWENWWYGASYSQRPMVETYALMAIPLAALLQQLLRQQIVMRLLFFVLLLATFILSVFQSRQFYMGVISNERMTKAAYWEVFGKLSFDASLYKLLEPDRGDNTFRSDSADFEIKPLVNIDFENSSAKNITLVSLNGNHCMQLDAATRNIDFLETEHTLITPKKYFWIRGSVDVFINDSADIDNTIMIIKTAALKNRVIKESAYQLTATHCKAGEWNTLSFDYITPNFFHNDDVVQVVLKYNGTSIIYIDNVNASAWIPTEDY